VISFVESSSIMTPNYTVWARAKAPAKRLMFIAFFRRSIIWQASDHINVGEENTNRCAG